MLIKKKKKQKTTCMLIIFQQIAIGCDGIRSSLQSGWDSISLPTYVEYCTYCGLSFFPIVSYLDQDWITSMEGDSKQNMFLFLLQKYSGLSASGAHIQVNKLLIMGDLHSIQWHADYYIWKLSW